MDNYSDLSYEKVYPPPIPDFVMEESKKDIAPADRTIWRLWLMSFGLILATFMARDNLDLLKVT